MDFSASCIDTSLDLSFNPSHHQVLHDDKKLLLAAAAAPLKTSFFDLGWKPPAKDVKAGELAEELKRVNEENKKLTEMLTVLCENYNTLRSRLTDYMNRNPETKEPTSSPKKRKSESSLNNNQINNNGIIVGMSESSTTNEDSSSKKIRDDETIKAKVSRVYVRTEASDATLVVKDGYQWRKYGQKVTRDNPFPRAYFKCSFAPSCPVKKKVQRSVEDQSVLVATYEGEHNHPHPAQLEGASGSNTGTSMTLGASVPSNTSPQATSGPPSVTLDLTKPKATVPEAKSSGPQRLNKPELQHFLVEQMASSLTNDPNFTAALAAAISGKMFNQTTMEKWL